MTVGLFLGEMAIGVDPKSLAFMRVLGLLQGRLNIGKRSLWMNGKRKNKTTGELEEHIHERFNQFEAKNFDLSRLLAASDA